MKTFFVILFLFVTGRVAATDYYVAANGVDANAGTSAATAWQTLTRVNSKTFVAGDRVLFRRGDVFYGFLFISQSGTSGNTITVGAYGSGAKPIINGFTTVPSWSNLGGNIWESAGAVSTFSSLNIVTIGGVNTPMGRYPNTGWLTYQSHSGNLSITSGSLTGTPNWTGAQVVLKKERWSTNTGTITSQPGGTLFYTDNGIDIPQDGYGFFIQNDARTLDAQNEWYYTSDKKLRIYSTSMPSNVQVPVVDSVLVVNGNYVSIQNIDFRGANNSAIRIVNKSNVVMDSCVVSYAGDVGIFLQGSTGSIIRNSYIHQTNGNGIRSDNNTTVEYCTVSNTSMVYGQVRTYSFGAICTSNGSLVQYNNVDSSGYVGIMLNGRTNSTIQNNFINHSCLLLDDGAGIYVSLSGSNTTIKNNVVLNTKGGNGGNAYPDNMGFGIYLDSYTTGTLVYGNTVSGCGGAGIFASNANANTITNNTLYNNSLGSGFSAQSELQVQHICCNAVADNIITDNIYFAPDPAKYAIFIYSITNDVPSWFSAMDNNYFLSNATNVVSTQISSTITDRTLSGWKSFTGKETSSSLVQPNLANVRFEYNATPESKTVTLDAKYTDVKGVQLNTGSIVLPAYTSAILTKTGALDPPNIPPHANAGPNQVIYLPEKITYK